MNNEDRTMNPEQALEIATEDARHKTNAVILECRAAMEPQIKHGAEWDASFFEKYFGEVRGTRAFGIKISELNRLLEFDGYSLTSRGKNGQAWWIRRADASMAVVREKHRDALDNLRRASLFAHAVLTKHSDKISESMKKRLEKEKANNALRYLFCKTTLVNRK